MPGAERRGRLGVGGAAHRVHLGLDVVARRRAVRVRDLDALGRRLSRGDRLGAVAPAAAARQPPDREHGENARALHGILLGGRRAHRARGPIQRPTRAIDLTSADGTPC
jgi:hypothetical protein